MSNKEKNIKLRNDNIIRKFFWNLNGIILTKPNRKLMKGFPPLIVHDGPVPLAAPFLVHLKLRIIENIDPIIRQINNI
ncbi:hypothetical protein ACQKM9_03705 [Viridibacillus sp. NPDC093762]|uniref:hypothetical protein n=1 Tax=Viridibacillus sp. NPDC093762 TaxID=3390720 RepID=UPI003CFD0DFE